MMSNDRGKAKRQDRYVRNIYSTICMASSACAVWGLFQMARACPEHAALVLGCVAVIAAARGDMLIRFGKASRHDRKH